MESYKLMGKAVLLCLLGSRMATAHDAPSLNPEAEGPDTQPKAASGWNRQVSFGTSTSEGNTDKSRVNLSFLAEMKDGTNEWRIALDGAYAETDEERTTENAKTALEYRRLIAERAYGLLRAQGLYDPVAGIDYRVGVGPGLGCYVVKRVKLTASVEAGPAYFWENLDGETDHFPVARLAERAEWNRAADLKVWQFVEYMPTLGESGRSLLSAETGIESVVRRRLGVQFKASLRLDSDPARGKEEEDFTYSTSFTYRF